MSTEESDQVVQRRSNLDALRALILDRVDVILSRREKGDARGTETTTSETILTNIRVLAIDQAVDGQKEER